MPGIEMEEGGQRVEALVIYDEAGAEVDRPPRARPKLARWRGQDSTRKKRKRDDEIYNGNGDGRRRCFAQ